MTEPICGQRTHGGYTCILEPGHRGVCTPSWDAETARLEPSRLIQCDDTAVRLERARRWVTENPMLANEYGLDTAVNVALAPPVHRPGAALGPIALNADQERLAKDWAADDRLWTTQETVEFNLRTFARAVLLHAAQQGGK